MTTLSRPTPSPSTDAEIAERICKEARNKEVRFALVVDTHRGAVMVRSGAGESWDCLAIGDIDDGSIQALCRLAKTKRATWSQVAELGDAVALASAAAHASALNTTALKQWGKSRDAVTGSGPDGRRGDISQRVRDEVIALAAWHCQMCGIDLRSHLAGGARGNYSYLAHIVAASKDGPRGDCDLPADQINAPANLMLLCDKCHRLIDRVDPGSYPRERLMKIRQQSINDVNRLLSTLAYPPAQILVIGGNISGQVPGFDQYIAEQAMWNQRLRPTGATDWFAHSGHLGDATKPHYWHSTFELLRMEVPKLRMLLNGSARGGVTASRLAVFPLHNMSVLILAGRLVGEGRSVYTFQFHRDAVSGQPGGQWNWPRTAEPAADKYHLRVLQPADGGKDAVLLFHLTTQAPLAEMPSTFQTDGRWILPVVEITVERPGHGVIGHTRDLELLGRALDEALHLLQDEWRVERVHCLMLAPASACFRLGQKLQAKFHKRIRLYEREQYRGSASCGQFVPTIDIHAGEAVLTGTEHSVPLS